MKLENSDIKNIRLASVDIVEESDLGDRFEIDLIPEFKFFINGTLSDVKYNMGTTSEEILNWLKKVHNEL